MTLFNSVKQFKAQDYRQLKKQQLARGVKFVDDEFPVESMNIHGVESSIEFKRPTELVEWPCLRSEEQYFSLKSGFVENFNLLLAFSCLKLQQKLWSKVFIDHANQDWKKAYPEEHPGIFHLRICQEGSFVDVTIDDRLPCRDGKLICTRSSSEKEFWPALLEKAYAKLMGGYDSLEHIRLEEILMDFTGGVTECIGLQSICSAPPMKHVTFYEKLEEALKEDTLVILCTEPIDHTASKSHIGFHNPYELNIVDQFGSPGPMRSELNPATGLCARYGYVLTRLCTVPKDTSLFGAFKDAFRRAGDCSIRTRLLRLRCPLSVTEGGAGVGEWTGPYSSTSPEWDELGLDVRKRLGLCFDSESEFWIPLDDVLKYMVGAVFCVLPDISVVNLTGGRTWQLNDHHGAWHGHQAGGSLRYRDTFFNNPQYTFDIASDGEQVLLTLIRKHDRDPSTLAIEPNYSSPPMGLGLFQVEKNRTTLVHKLAFTRVIYVEAARPYRTVLVNRILNVGRYVVVPFLEEPLAAASYLLRLYLPKRTVSKELLLHFPLKTGAFDFFHGPLKEAVRVHIHSAANLSWDDGKNPPSPYCIITGEETALRTCVRNSTSNPVWDEFFIFYRRRPNKVPIVIEIFDKRTLGFDVFLGRHCFKETEIAEQMQQELALFGRDTKDERFFRMKGSLFVDFYRVDSENFMQI